MIRQIDHLRDFGIYRDFQWGVLPAFAKCNLIYGWNYSGKTTLSRLFQIFENIERIANWPSSSFRVVLSDGSIVSHTSLETIPPPKTRVFNREFVTWNFAQEHTAPAVFILGAQNVALRQRLQILNRRRDRVVQLEASLQARARQAQGEVDQIGTDKARDAGSLLGDRIFRRPNLMRRVEEVRQNNVAYLLTDAEVGLVPTVRIGAGAWRPCQACVQAATPVEHTHATDSGNNTTTMAGKGNY